MCVFLRMCMYVCTYTHACMYICTYVSVLLFQLDHSAFSIKMLRAFFVFLESGFLLVTNKKNWEYNALAAAHSYRIQTQLCVHTYSMQFIHTYDTKSRQHTYADTSVYIDTNTHNTYTTAAAAQFPIGLYSLPQSPFDLTLFCITLDIFLCTFNHF